MAIAAAGTDRRFLARPTAKTGLWAWMTTVDHKKIGILYGYTAFVFFIIGGVFIVWGVRTQQYERALLPAETVTPAPAAV